MKKAEGLSYLLGQKEAGVTLLLALLILASILAISFSLATIVFIEVRNSSDLLKTEGAFYASSGLGEQAFFNLVRKVSNPPAYVSNFTNNVNVNGAPSVVATNTPIFLDKVLPNIDFDHTTNKYDFCNLSATASGCGYGKIKLSYISTGHDTDTLYAYLCQFDPNAVIGTYSTLPCTTPSTVNASQAYWLAPTGDENQGSFNYSEGNVPLTGVVNTVVWTLDPSRQQELILTSCNAAHSCSSNNIYFSVSTFASDGVTPKGLPYVGKTAILVNTQTGAVSRKIQITVPNGGYGANNSTPTNFSPDTNKSLATGLVSYWNMDEASGNRADLVGSNSLTESGVFSASGTGGDTVTTGGGYVTHTFTSGGTFIPNGATNVEVLIVGGGGGGGHNRGGGGGGGGVIYYPNFAVTKGSYTVTVGNGGNGGTAVLPATKGQDSSFGSITALGGGFGVSSDANTAPSSGGSGGGASGDDNATTYGASVGGHGNRGGGGAGGNMSRGGGGGGGSMARGATGDGSNGGAGGDGLTYSISGIAIAYGGGGGGGTITYTDPDTFDVYTGTPGTGGNGGGGDGSTEDSGQNGGDALAHRGGGGGGSGYGTRGGNGGSGVVIVRYPIAASGGVPSSAGIIGNAAQLNQANSHKLSIADNSSLSVGGTDFSIAAWVRLDDNGNPNSIFLTKGDPSIVRYEYTMGYDSTTDKFYFKVWDSGNSSSTVTVNNPSSPVLGKWYFLSGWYDSGANTLNLKVNNGSTSTKNNSVTPYDSSYPFFIGPSVWYQYNGRVDEVGFWKKVLSSQEITDLYNSGNGNTYTPTTQAFYASGGTVTTSNGYTIHTFTSSGTFVPNIAGTVEVLVVGGGGGGGDNQGGGGGGGGVIYHPAYAVSPQAYGITIGNGGVGGSATLQGVSGDDSIFDGLSAQGGGGGGGSDDVTSGAATGGSGGGGNAGGGMGTGGATTQNSPNGFIGYGHAGGNGFDGSSYACAGGGGGAGVAGETGGPAGATCGGDGGNGKAFSISGSSVYYAGGGGGGGYSARGVGGLGGGGDGSNYFVHTNGSDGSANTGGGGGGEGGGASHGGHGGSGVVIIRYLSP